MADDVTVKAGSSGSDLRMATDEAAYDGVNQSHAELIKLVDGTADSTTRIRAAAGTAANALRVVLASDDPAVTALQIMDDWDEADRAKVNLIAGVAGITAGAGNVAAGTPRVTMAADSPDVALLTTIDADTGNLAGILTSVQLIDDAAVVLGTATYTEATSTGLAIGAVRRDADTTLVNTTNEWGPLQMDANGRLKVEVFSGETLPVSLTSTTITGTVTVDSELTTADLDTGAGTDTRAVVGLVRAESGGGVLVGSANALPVQLIASQNAITAGAGAVGAATPRVTLASDDPAVTSLAIMDDWDETDRCKVNLIVGVAGITAGAGAVASGTPRMTLASDDPAVVSLQLIDDTIYTDDTSTHTTASSKGIGIMAVATPTDAAVNANDFGHIAMTTDRKLHVAVMDALPAGTAAIGKLAANSGVDIGDVDVTSITPGTTATSLGKAEDAGHTTGDVGVMALAVRNDAGTSLAGTDLDYVPLTVNASGALYVTGGGGGTQYVEDDAAAADPTGTVLMLIRDDLPVAGLVSLDGDNVAARGNNFGGQYVTLMGSDGATLVPAAAALADNTSNPTTTGIAVYNMVFDGSTWDRLYGTSTGGAFVQGPIAHDSAVTSATNNPLLLGALADTDADVTAVSTDGDAVRLVSDLKGRLAVRPIKFQTFIVVNSANLTTATTAYTAGDTLGLASSVPATFSSAARVSGGTGIIRGIYVLDKADITGVVTVFIFRASVTLAADNAAWSVSDTDMESCILRQQISMTDEGNQRVGFWSGYTPFDCNASDLFVGMRTDTAHTFFGAASDIRTKLWIEQD